MTQKSIIIGAGVSGLCAGIYGQMNGYQTRIFEKHKIPGGLVTAFRRKGYLVEVCIHWLTGLGPGVVNCDEPGHDGGRGDSYAHRWACSGFAVVHLVWKSRA